ncbi:di- and tripeptidase [Rothia dentocariosa]|uniref:di- and tripeptidase n=1 Tax=Rothia dentocariosa TaxID=2047 RepID=UPI002491095B|nr:di- and tripeptidase [Rothia dentocariosa]
MLDPKKSLFDDNGNPRPALTKTLDTVLRVQRPLALSMVKSLRSGHPDETPEKILRRLERNYLRDVTAIGGVTGASAFVPGIGTVTSMSLSALAVGGYLERTALFAQAVAELHGVHVENPEVARSMVMAIMLGEEGSQLMNTVLLQTGKASGVSNRWGTLLGGKSAGKTFSVERTIRNMFIKRFLTRQSGALLGRALPFGVGAVVGGGANLALGRDVVKSARNAFGDAPAFFPAELMLTPRAPKFTSDEQKNSHGPKVTRALTSKFKRTKADTKNHDAHAQGLQNPGAQHRKTMGN